MKKIIFPLVIISFAMITSCENRKDSKQQETESIPFTAQELLDKCIAYHDPDGQWSTYAGKVHLVYVTPTGQSNEIIELNNLTGFYQDTFHYPDGDVTLGIRDGQCFYIVSGNENPTEDQLKTHNLNDDRTRFMAALHHIHFGFPMELKLSEVQLKDKVSKEMYNERMCYAFEAVGDSTKLTNDFFTGKFKVYVNPDNFSFQGYSAKIPGYPEFDAIHEGEMAVNGIILAQTHMYYKIEDNSLMGVNVFTPMVD